METDITVPLGYSDRFPEPGLLGIDAQPVHLAFRAGEVGADPFDPDRIRMRAASLQHGRKLVQGEAGAVHSGLHFNVYHGLFPLGLGRVNGL